MTAAALTETLILDFPASAWYSGLNMYCIPASASFFGLSIAFRPRHDIQAYAWHTGLCMAYRPLHGIQASAWHSGLGMADRSLHVPLPPDFLSAIGH